MVARKDNGPSGTAELRHADLAGTTRQTPPARHRRDTSFREAYEGLVSDAARELPIPQPRKNEELLEATHAEYDGVAVLLEETFGFDVAEAERDGDAPDQPAMNLNSATTGA